MISNLHRRKGYTQMVTKLNTLNKEINLRFLFVKTSSKTIKRCTRSTFYNSKDFLPNDKVFSCLKKVDIFNSH